MTASRGFYTGGPQYDVAETTSSIEELVPAEHLTTAAMFIGPIEAI